ncbi:MAG: cyclic nucleotide-binding domain-containing protein, partial [Bacteroidota bacterium]
MNNTETTTFLLQVDLFKGLTPEETVVLTSEAITKVYPAGSDLFRENEPRREIFILFSGKVELFKKDPEGNETTLTVFGRGDFLGEGSLMDDYLHSTSARALVEAEVFCIGPGFFIRNAGIGVKVMSNIARIISRRLRYANNQHVSETAQYESGRRRSEHDLLGTREVPYEYYFGIQTLRALENFNISGIRLSAYPVFIEAIIRVKMAAAK